MGRGTEFGGGDDGSEPSRCRTDVLCGGEVIRVTEEAVWFAVTLAWNGTFDNRRHHAEGAGQS